MVTFIDARFNLCAAVGSFWWRVVDLYGNLTIMLEVNQVIHLAKTQGVA